MTPGERFLTALRGGMPDRLPMIIWNNKLPGGEMDEAIFELGVCLIVKSSVWKLSLNGIEVKSADRPVQGEGIQRTTQYAT